MNIFLQSINPLGKKELSRKYYILTIFLIYILKLVALVIINQEVLFLIFIALMCYINTNINAQRARNSGLKGRYIVLLSLVVYLISGVLIAGYGDDCESISVKLNVGYDLLTIFMLAIAPPKCTTDIQQGMIIKEIK